MFEVRYKNRPLVFTRSVCRIKIDERRISEKGANFTLRDKLPFTITSLWGHGVCDAWAGESVGSEHNFD